MKVSKYSIPELEGIRDEIEAEIENRKEGIKLRKEYFMPDNVSEETKKELLKILENPEKNIYVNMKLLIGEVRLILKYLNCNIYLYSESEYEWVLTRKTTKPNYIDYRYYESNDGKIKKTEKMYLTKEDLKSYIELLLKK